MARQDEDTQSASETDVETDHAAIGLKRDDKRPDDQFTITLFDRDLTIGGEIEIFSEYDNNFNLDKKDRQDETFIDQSFSLEIVYEVSDTVSFFADTSGFHSQDVQSQGDVLTSSKAIDRGQAWLLVEELFDPRISLQVGPQYFSETREWWWDDVLDGVSLHYSGEQIYSEHGVAGIIAPISTDDDDIDPERKDITWVLSKTEWTWAEQHSLELLFLYQNDYSHTEQLDELVDEDREDDNDGNLYWLGFRSTGHFITENASRFDYWLDTGVVRGRETVLDFVEDEPGVSIADDVFKQDVFGWAVDLGVTWQSGAALQPRFTLSFAMGSGDSDFDNDKARAFRQTGLESNSGTFGGVSWFSYYGELLDPELSNLRIWTVAVGLNFLNSSSIEILYHNYQQVDTTDFLRSASVEEDPSGEDKDIGQELDIVLGLEEWKHFELELIAAFFKPGAAFDSSTDDLASSVVLRIDYNF